MKTILLPVDFSEHTPFAYRFAVKISTKEEPVNLILMHSYNDQIFVTDSGIGGTFESDAFLNVQLIEEFKMQSEENMKKLKAEVDSYLKSEGYTNFTVHTLVKGGDPDMEITEVCDELTPGLIVMGTEGKGKKGFLAGSMAKKIMNKCVVPVIAVPSEVDIKREFRIMYASNNSEKDYMKLQLLMKMFENINTKIFVVHFHHQGDTKDEASPHLNDLKDAFEAESINNKIHFSLIDTSDYDQAIEAMVDEYKINAVAFIAHHKNFFHSLFSRKISKDDFFDLGLPMVALHE